MTRSHKIFVNPSEFNLMCIASYLTAFVNHLMMTRTALYPWHSGIGPVMSVVMTSQGHDGGSKGEAGYLKVFNEGSFIGKFHILQHIS
jgi:hypothetical protein